MVKSLFELVSDKVNKDYNKYKNDIPDHILEQMYDGWYKDNKLNKRVTKHKDIIKNFMLYENELIIDKSTNKERLRLHNWFNGLKIKHKSYNENGKRILKITKPKKWKWNPNLKVKKKVNKKIDNYDTIFCENCGKNANEKELYINYTGVGPYCCDCLDIVPDGNGNMMSAHKFEHIDCIYSRYSYECVYE
jgi:hypothetical protein